MTLLQRIHSAPDVSRLQPLLAEYEHLTDKKPSAGNTPNWYEYQFESERQLLIYAEASMSLTFSDNGGVILTVH